MYIFSKTFWKATGNNLSLLVVLIIVFLLIPNMILIHVERAIASDKATAKTMQKSGCEWSWCDPQCLPISLGFSVDVMEILPTQVVLCVSNRAMGRDLGGGWFTALIYANGKELYPCRYHSEGSGCLIGRKTCTDWCYFSGDSIVITTSTIEFNAIGEGLCRCWTDAVTISIALPDTTEEDTPEPQELGPQDNCASSVGY